MDSHADCPSTQMHTRQVSTRTARAAAPLRAAARLEQAANALGLLSTLVAEAESGCACCSCVCACVVCCTLCVCAAQGWCCCRREGSCAGLRRTLSEQQHQIVAGRCSRTSDTRSICQHHYDVWLHRYTPQSCAVCPAPLTTAFRACPGWLTEQLHVPRGSFVHKRPCYEQALAERKHAASSAAAVAAAAAATAAAASPHPASMDTSHESENEPNSTFFMVDVRDTRRQHRSGSSNGAHRKDCSDCLSFPRVCLFR